MFYTRPNNHDIRSKTGVFYTNMIGVLREGVLEYHDGTLVIGGFDAQGQRHGVVYIIDGQVKTQATYENGTFQKSIPLASFDDLPKQYHQFLPESIDLSGCRQMVPSSAVASYMRQEHSNTSSSSSSQSGSSRTDPALEK
jgi:hypothetical protein